MDYLVVDIKEAQAIVFRIVKYNFNNLRACKCFYQYVYIDADRVIFHKRINMLDHAIIILNEI